MGSPLRPREAATNPPPSPSRSGHGRAAPASSAADRAVLHYLQRDILPELERDHLGAAKGVERALRLGTLEPLHTMSAVDKHKLLGTVEAKVGRTSRPGPSVVVKLISALELTPSETSFDHRRPVLPLR